MCVSLRLRNAACTTSPPHMREIISAESSPPHQTSTATERLDLWVHDGRFSVVNAKRASTHARISLVRSLAALVVVAPRSRSLALFCRVGWSLEKICEYFDVNMFFL